MRRLRGIDPLQLLAVCGLGFMLYALLFGLSEQTCASYASDPIGQIPAGCMDYFMTTKN